MHQKTHASALRTTDIAYIGLFVAAMAICSWISIPLVVPVTLQTFAVFLAVGALAATDFDRAFVIFHSIFFPGKTNWIFDWRTDPIILLLPEDFFRNCAILILVLLVFWCAVLIAADLLAGRRRKKGQAVPTSCPGCSGGAGQ